MPSGETNKRTRKETEKIVNDLGYILLDEYTNKYRQKNVIIQDEYGYKYDIVLRNLMRQTTINFVDKGNPF